MASSSSFFAHDEPAYICLERYPLSLEASLAAGKARSPQRLASSLCDRGEDSLTGKVGMLSLDSVGCRRVQDALDKASAAEEREALVQELHGRAVSCMKSAHANHVLQKCISTMPAESLQFIVDELMERDGLATQMAKHRYGGRIVQQLLKKCSAAQVSELAEVLLQDAVTLLDATFGTYAMQHLLRFGTEDQRHRLAQTIASNIGAIGRSSAGSGAVAAAVEHAAPEDRVAIARAVVREPGLSTFLAQGRHSYYAVPQMLEALSETERRQARRSLAQDLPSLQSARYGRHVARYVETAMALEQTVSGRYSACTDRLDESTLSACTDDSEGCTTECATASSSE